MGESRLQDGLCLTENAHTVLSDSGTICEESAVLGFPAVTCRNVIERPEAMDAGTIVVTGLNPDTIVDAIRLQTSESARAAKMTVPADYEIENTSWRVLKLIVGPAKLSPMWDGIRPNDLA